MHSGGMMFGMGFGWILGIFILAALIWMIYFIVNHNNRTRQMSNNSALEILKERYARGEIDDKKFEEMKQTVND